MKLTPEKKMTKARSGLILDHPFFGSLALRLQVIPEIGCKTSSVDGTIMKYNPELVDDFTLNQAKALFARQVMHCALLHHTRRQDRDPVKWNKAACYAVDQLLLDAGFEVPNPMIRSDIKGYGVERIYALLPDEDGKNDKDEKNSGAPQTPGGATPSGKPPDSKQDPNNQDPAKIDPDGKGYVIDAPAKDGRKNPTDTDMAEQESDWQVALVQATQQAEKAGYLPGGIKRIVKEMLTPKINWREQLWNFVDSSCKDDYTWMIPNKRYIQQGCILPSLFSEKLGKAVAFGDTSGSVSKAQLAQYSAELTSILEMFNLELHLYYCDSKVQGDVTIYRQEDLPVELEFRGGGGTNFKPAFKQVEDDNIQPKFLIYFTDLQVNDRHFPETHPDYPVLWAKVGSKGMNPPFGEVLNLEI